MKVCVFGLWHLGCVTAACLSELGIKTVGLDTDACVVDGLNRGEAPLYEPGLNDIIQKNAAGGGGLYLPAMRRRRFATRILCG
jgi:UDPglucose 6-dehydrogenase